LEKLARKMTDRRMDDRRKRAEEIEATIRAAIAAAMPEFVITSEHEVGISRLATRMSALFDTWQKVVKETAEEELPGGQRLGLSLTTEIDFDL